MKRRSFLALLGLGVPAAALAKTAIDQPAEAADSPIISQTPVRVFVGQFEMGTFTAGTLATSDGKMKFDLDKGELRFTA